MTRAPGHLPLFDALRAIAAGSVLMYHLALFGGTPDALADYAAHLNVGVPIFFLISGFLLYRPFARAHLAAEPGVRVRAYAWRRVLRIVPAYWAFLTAAVIVGAEAFPGGLLRTTDSPRSTTPGRRSTASGPRGRCAWR